MSVICIIPARGGSKGLPRKNVLPVNGKPLISYTIIQALESCIDSVYVTTDDEEIANVSSGYGANIITRPKELAEDTTTTEQTLTHALQQIEVTRQVDIVVYLSCTQPYRDVNWINTCVDKVRYGDYDSACVGYKTTKNYWRPTKDNHYKVWWWKYSSRQEREYILQENTGAACAVKSNIIRRGERIGDSTYILETDRYNVDIHEATDLQIAEIFLK